MSVAIDKRVWKSSSRLHTDKDVYKRQAYYKAFRSACYQLNMAGNFHLHLQTLKERHWIAYVDSKPCHQCADASIHIRNAVMLVDKLCQGCFSTALSASDPNSLIHYHLL